MAQRTDSFDIGRLALATGEGRRIETVVAVDALRFGGELYDADVQGVPVVLEVARIRAGYSLRLRYEVGLSGPCMRCLEAARRRIAVDATEIDQRDGGDELSSPYLEGDDLDLRAWARDALALALPPQILCGDDCRGLCGVCGANLNEADAHEPHESAPDSRWAKLSELRFE